MGEGIGEADDSGMLEGIANFNAWWENFHLAPVRYGDRVGRVEISPQLKS